MMEASPLNEGHDAEKTSEEVCKAIEGLSRLPDEKVETAEFSTGDDQQLSDPAGKSVVEKTVEAPVEESVVRAGLSALASTDALGSSGLSLSAVSTAAQALQPGGNVNWQGGPVSGGSDSQGEQGDEGCEEEEDAMKEDAGDGAELPPLVPPESSPVPFAVAPPSGADASLLDEEEAAEKGAGGGSVPSGFEGGEGGESGAGDGEGFSSLVPQKDSEEGERGGMSLRRRGGREKERQVSRQVVAGGVDMEEDSDAPLRARRSRGSSGPRIKQEEGGREDGDEGGVKVSAKDSKSQSVRSSSRPFERLCVLPNGLSVHWPRPRNEETQKKLKSYCQRLLDREGYRWAQWSPPTLVNWHLRNQSYYVKCGEGMPVKGFRPLDFTHKELLKAAGKAVRFRYRIAGPDDDPDEMRVPEPHDGQASASGGVGGVSSASPPGSPPSRSAAAAAGGPVVSRVPSSAAAPADVPDGSATEGDLAEVSGPMSGLDGRSAPISREATSVLCVTPKTSSCHRGDGEGLGVGGDVAASASGAGSVSADGRQLRTGPRSQRGGGGRRASEVFGSSSHQHARMQKFQRDEKGKFHSKHGKSIADLTRSLSLTNSDVKVKSEDGEEGDEMLEKDREAAERGGASVESGAGGEGGEMENAEEDKEKETAADAERTVEEMTKMMVQKFVLIPFEEMKQDRTGVIPAPRDLDLVLNEKARERQEKGKEKTKEASASASSASASSSDSPEADTSSASANEGKLILFRPAQGALEASEEADDLPPLGPGSSQASSRGAGAEGPRVRTRATVRSSRAPSEVESDRERGVGRQSSIDAADASFEGPSGGPWSGGSSRRTQRRNVNSVKHRYASEDEAIGGAEGYEDGMAGYAEGLYEGWDEEEEDEDMPLSSFQPHIHLPSAKSPGGRGGRGGSGRGRGGGRGVKRETPQKTSSRKRGLANDPAASILPSRPRKSTAGSLQAARDRLLNSALVASSSSSSSSAAASRNRRILKIRQQGGLSPGGFSDDLLAEMGDEEIAALLRPVAKKPRKSGEAAAAGAKRTGSMGGRPPKHGGPRKNAATSSRGGGASASSGRGVKREKQERGSPPGKGKNPSSSRSKGGRPKEPLPPHVTMEPPCACLSWEPAKQSWLSIVKPPLPHKPRERRVFVSEQVSSVDSWIDAKTWLELEAEACRVPPARMRIEFPANLDIFSTPHGPPHPMCVQPYPHPAGVGLPPGASMPPPPAGASSDGNGGMGMPGHSFDQFLSGAGGAIPPGGFLWPGILPPFGLPPTGPPGPLAGGGSLSRVPAPNPNPEGLAASSESARLNPKGNGRSPPALPPVEPGGAASSSSRSASRGGPFPLCQVDSFGSAGSLVNGSAPVVFPEGGAEGGAASQEAGGGVWGVSPPPGGGGSAGLFEGGAGGYLQRQPGRGGASRRSPPFSMLAASSGTSAFPSSAFLKGRGAAGEFGPESQVSVSAGGGREREQADEGGDLDEDPEEQPEPGQQTGEEMGDLQEDPGMPSENGGDEEMGDAEAAAAVAEEWAAAAQDLEEMPGDGEDGGEALQQQEDETGGGGEDEKSG
uniref:Uncharacterized protein n=1 Tax=Chromera velia CCMP2878 TaxID=1169474 RepID=A0A0G4FLC7_9ALVE|eukprot:Cvel_17589.t1-p1 / transcript=Cvel_17589.t1 / gene=Cvel_17589 / organism=Chromera_velia_CCMP2878 / gene_product=hypothetical protein / transcript_product=hypothetical protein / location=Cvel_scaffold1414:17234-23257(+) / protein_length=1558 / sequence_SO=supercontig / SO=protein_coding / is_pseudo=false